MAENEKQPGASEFEHQVDDEPSNPLPDCVYLSLDFAQGPQGAKTLLGKITFGHQDVPVWGGGIIKFGVVGGTLSFSLSGCRLQRLATSKWNPMVASSLDVSVGISHDLSRKNIENKSASFTSGTTASLSVGGNKEKASAKKEEGKYSYMSHFVWVMGSDVKPKWEFRVPSVAQTELQAPRPGCRRTLQGNLLDDEIKTLIMFEAKQAIIEAKFQFFPRDLEVVDASVVFPLSISFVKRKICLNILRKKLLSNIPLSFNIYKLDTERK